MTTHKIKRYATKEHEHFFADVAKVMDKHAAISGNFLLAEVHDRSKLQLVGSDENCTAWATDPRTNKVYCIQHGGG